MVNLKSCIGASLLILLSACSSIPKSSTEKVSHEEAQTFLKKYCTPMVSQGLFEKELTGEVIVRSSTKEFKGQYPASIHFSKNKEFTVEVTNMIGGTVTRLTGDEASIDVFSPGRPQYSRKGIHQYMGLSVPMFALFIHGDLPCPAYSSIRLDGNSVVIQDSGGLEWWFERSDQASGSVPVQLRIFDHGKVKVEMVIESWNSGELYAEKARVHTAEGDLRWTWRSRELK